MKKLLLFNLALVCFANSQTIYFDTPKFSTENLNDWLKNGPQNAFVYPPMGLYMDRNFEKRIADAKLVLNNGALFDFDYIKNEISEQVKIGNFVPLFGWSEALAHSSMSPRFCVYAADQLNTSNSESINFIYCYVINSHISHLESRHVGPFPFDDVQIAELIGKLKATEIKISTMGYAEAACYRT